jgi:hypothetical protein
VDVVLKPGDFPLELAQAGAGANGDNDGDERQPEDDYDGQNNYCFQAGLPVRDLLRSVRR